MTTNEADPLHALADAAGLARQWSDVDGRAHVVPDEALRAVLEALGHRAGNRRQVQSSLAAIRDRRGKVPALLVADTGQPLPLPFPCATAAVTGADGRTVPLAITAGTARAPDVPGYFNLEIDGQVLRLAVAPPHCPLPLPADRRAWGAALQIPALRGPGQSEFGGFGDLADAVEALARCGADAVAINPVHALFPGHGREFSPYSPSSRRFLNGAMGDPALLGLSALPPGEAGPLIDWEGALPRRLTHLRTAFAGLPDGLRAKIERLTQDDAALRRHAVFDALDCRFRPRGAGGWQDWPARYRNPDNAAVAQFAREQADEVSFHTFVQWLASEGLVQVQQRARTAGMAIGLVGDLAVGVHPGGSDAWALGHAMLRGLTIGAPPDPLGPQGQNWSITTFSPEGLRDTGYEPWIAMLRAALSAGGGLRIDHAFGLARLWVIPEGGTSADGCYVTYPFDDLLRLATLEAHLAGSLVIAENLGTAPPGFAQAIAARRMLGMRVLWFERAADHGFIGAHDYESLSVAMTGTHDTPTLAGWWSGKDLDWADRLGRLPADVNLDQARAIRDWDRGLLWSSLAGHHPRPALDDPQPAVDAAIGHIARTPAALAIVPLEDLLGSDEQPNLPGTVNEHPNWRRRHDAPLEVMLADKRVANRMKSLGSAPA